MFTRHLIAAAALMAATCAANADVITTTTTDSSGATLSSDMSIVDTSTALSGADAGLAAILATSNAKSQLVLVRGVEGLYMLASRTNAPLAAATQTGTTTDASADAVTVPATTPVSTPAAAAEEASDIVTAPVTAPLAISISLPTVNATAVPEPATLALMFAGLLGVFGFARARKQG
jgi:hypothetical protein